MIKYLNLIRIKHYIKNVLIFVPMICAMQITGKNILISILAFFSFGFLCSAVYIMNDIRDIEQDRQHPKKKNRPLASGAVKKGEAIVISIVLLCLSFGLNMVVNHFRFFNLSFVFLVAYALINLAYSFGLKNFAILDIVLLATDFVLRVYYGAAIFSIEVSPWLFLTILSASMFMGLGKRKKELIKTPSARKVLKEYNEAFLDKYQSVMLSLVLVFYSLWTVQQGIVLLNFSVVLVLVILMRYSLIIEKTDEGDPTSVLYSDKILLVLCLIYAIFMLCIFLSMESVK